jgi:alanyl-tRNA synthetase
MIRTASKLTEREAEAVTMFYGKDEKTVRFVVMVGRKALEKGAKANEIANETARLLGGGGSGRPEFAQGGGTKADRIDEAIKKAEETLKKQVSKKPK